MPAKTTPADQAAKSQSEPTTGHVTFSELARSASHALGSGWAFWTACAVVLVWGVIPPLLTSDLWNPGIGA